MTSGPSSVWICLSRAPVRPGLSPGREEEEERGQQGPPAHRFFPLSAPKELEALQQVWEITRDWEENWSQWKTGRFLMLQTEAMEATAHGLFRRLTRLAKEYKVLWARGGAARQARGGRGRCGDAGRGC